MPKPTSLIINSPYTAPSRHWQFTEEGQPPELAQGRRTAEYTVANPKEKIVSWQGNREFLGLEDRKFRHDASAAN